LEPKRNTFTLLKTDEAAAKRRRLQEAEKVGKTRGGKGVEKAGGRGDGPQVAFETPSIKRWWENRGNRFHVFFIFIIICKSRFASLRSFGFKLFRPERKNADEAEGKKEFFQL